MQKNDIACNHWIHFGFIAWPRVAWTLGYCGISRDWCAYSIAFLKLGSLTN